MKASLRSQAVITWNNCDLLNFCYVIHCKLTLSTHKAIKSLRSLHVQAEMQSIVLPKCCAVLNYGLCDYNTNANTNGSLLGIKA